MQIRIVGRGPIAEPLARLAERAGHTVRWPDEGAAPTGADDAPDLVILAFSGTTADAMLASILPAIAHDVVVVDASIPAATLPHARLVRAFASVPAEALVAVLDRPTSEQSASLAVPLAGDDREAKALVMKFMREIGVEPFDLGALAIAAGLDPGGALWRKALSQVEMLEAVGYLSGDG
jgi:hypothetical protein